MSSGPSDQELLANLQRLKAEKAEQRRLAALKAAEEEAALEEQIMEAARKAEERRLEEERRAEEVRQAAEALKLAEERKRQEEAERAEAERRREEAVQKMDDNAKLLSQAAKLAKAGAVEREFLETVYGPVAVLPDGLLTMPPEKAAEDGVRKKVRKTGPKSKAVVEDSGDDGSVKIPAPKITNSGLYEPGKLFCVGRGLCVKAEKKECRVPMRSDTLFRGTCVSCATAKTGCDYSARGKDKDRAGPAPSKKKLRRGSPKATGSRKRPLTVSSGPEDSDAEKASLGGLWSLVGKVSGRTKKIETAVEGLAKMDAKLDELMKIAVRPDIPDSDDVAGWTEWFEEEAKENRSDVAAEATRLI
ncbi:hypothetical protein ONZ45_g17978 [Pleurotus djamor]|nr:hypothetical protein ONZ45_g17978 [Pleurotus djamor]